jgi:G:T/U-mismatch repair DNA glycosylase
MMDKMGADVEQHPFKPFLPPKAKVLILGSFPPPEKRWSINFYYPNLQNDFWRICGLIFFNDKEYFLMPDAKAFNLDTIVAFLEEKGIAMYDTASAVKRLKNNASDVFLEIIKTTDVASLLDKMPLCNAIAVTGGKATDLLLPQFHIMQPPKVGSNIPFVYNARDMQLYRLPSSSRAYPLPLIKKTAIYCKMFDELGIH